MRGRQRASCAPASCTLAKMKSTSSKPSSRPQREGLVVCANTIFIGLFEARLSQRREHSEKRQDVPECNCNDNHGLAGALRRRCRCDMQAVTGVFLSPKEAEQAIRK